MLGVFTCFELGRGPTRERRTGRTRRPWKRPRMQMRKKILKKERKT